MSFIGDFLGFGGGGDTNLPKGATVNTPGFDLSSDLGVGGNVNTSFRRKGTPEQQAFDERFPRILGDIDTLRGTITPGFSNLRKSRLDAVARVFDVQRGSLKSSFAQRRLGGSSFAANELARLAREESSAAGDAASKSFLDELNANTAILGLENAQVAAGLEREFRELGAATGFGTNITNMVSQNQRVAAELEGQEQAGAGSFFGSLLKLGAQFIPGPKGSSVNPRITRGGIA